MYDIHFEVHALYWGTPAGPKPTQVTRTLLEHTGQLVNLELELRMFPDHQSREYVCFNQPVKEFIFSLNLNM